MPAPVRTQQERYYSSSLACASSEVSAVEDDQQAINFDGPTGDLFVFPKDIGSSLTGKTASIHRTFGPRANSEAMLTCGYVAMFISISTSAVP